MFTFKHRRNNGFSITETVIAMAIGSMAISGAAALNSHQLRLVKATREANAATNALQERLEQIRNASWKQITDAEFLTGSVLSTVPRSLAPISDYEETIAVSRWKGVIGITPTIRITKEPDSDARVLSAGDGFAGERLLKVVARVKWCAAGVERVREAATVVSIGGINRVNLPCMGPVGGGAWEAPATPAPAPAPAPVPAAPEAPVIDGGGLLGGLASALGTVSGTGVASPTTVNLSRGTIGGALGVR